MVVRAEKEKQRKQSDSEERGSYGHGGRSPSDEWVGGDQRVEAEGDYDGVIIRCSK